MALVKVEGHNGYLKNTETGVVLNNNVSEIDAARKRKVQRKQQEDDINNLKNEVSDIKQMLGKLMETIRIIYNLMMARKDQHLVIFL